MDIDLPFYSCIDLLLTLWWKGFKSYALLGKEDVKSVTFPFAANYLPVLKILYKIKPFRGDISWYDTSTYFNTWGLGMTWKPLYGREFSRVNATAIPDDFL